MATYAEAVTSREREQIRSASGLNIAIGIWLIVAPFLLAASGAAFWNDIIFGAAIVILAGVRVSRPAATTKPASWVNAIIGGWLVIAPFALGYVATAAIWNDVIVGAIVLLLGVWSGSQPRTAIDTRDTRAAGARTDRTAATRSTHATPAEKRMRR